MLVVYRIRFFIMSKQTLSVVIPAFNEELYIGDCIKSVQNQTRKPDEIIVVNNSSMDKTVSIAQSFGVKVLNVKLKGLCYVRQAGLDAAKGEILVYLDADTRFPPLFLEKALLYMQKHKDVSAISCNYYFFDGRVMDIFGLWVFREIIAPFTNLLLRLFQRPDILIFLTVVLRTQALRNAGGISKNFLFYGDDASLALRMHTQGKVHFLRNLYVYSSARRYQRLGLFQTIYYYWSTFIFMNTGLVKYAQRFSRKYSAQPLDYDMPMKKA